MLANPYAIRYATEARMYALEMLLVACGIVAFQRASRTPTLGRARGVRARRRALAVHAVLVVLSARRRRCRAGLDDAGATEIATRPARCWSRWSWAASPSCRGCRRSCTSARTRARLGHAGSPGHPVRLHAARLRGRRAARGERRRAGCSSCPVPAAAARRVRTRADNRRIEVDVRTQREVRVTRSSAAPGSSSGSRSTTSCGGAFQSRYSAIVFPFFVLLVARGFTTLRDPRSSAGCWWSPSGSGSRRRAQHHHPTHPSRRGRGVLRTRRSRATSSCTAPTSSGPRCTARAARDSTRSCIPSFAGPSGSTGSTTRRVAGGRRLSRPTRRPGRRTTTSGTSLRRATSRTPGRARAIDERVRHGRPMPAHFRRQDLREARARRAPLHRSASVDSAPGRPFVARPVRALAVIVVATLVAVRHLLTTLQVADRRRARRCSVGTAGGTATSRATGDHGGPPRGPAVLPAPVPIARARGFVGARCRRRPLAVVLVANVSALALGFVVRALVLEERAA